MAQLFVDLLVWNRTARFFVGLAARKGLQDIEVVLHVIKRAVVRESSQERANGLFSGHDLAFNLPTAYEAASQTTTDRVGASVGSAAISTTRLQPRRRHDLPAALGCKPC